jgi:hypothetical protein
MSKTSRLSDRFPVINDVVESMIRQYDFDLRCAAPGIIREFNADEQTVKVQLAIKEITYVKNVIESKTIPELVDVPLISTRAGNFIITVPVAVGDECLVIFGDTCIDSWWKLGEDKDNPQSKGAQEPMSIRRHDLSDGFAILAPSSQKIKVGEIVDYATDCLEIRTLDGKNKIQVKDDAINAFVNEDTSIEIEDGTIMLSYKGETILTLEDGTVTITSDSVKLGGSSGLQKLIDERILALINNHVHLYNPGPGSPTSTAVPTVPILAAACATTITEAK